MALAFCICPALQVGFCLMSYLLIVRHKHIFILLIMDQILLTHACYVLPFNLV
jgi:hypothetical protein